MSQIVIPTGIKNHEYQILQNINNNSFIKFQAGLIVEDEEDQQKNGNNFKEYKNLAAINSKYTNVHAFNKKRTLANCFFNAQKITHANNKQFQAMSFRNKQHHAFESLDQVYQKISNQKQTPRPQILKQTSPLNEQVNYDKNEKMKYLSLEQQLQNLTASQLSSANYYSNEKVEIYDGQKQFNWDDKNPLATNFTLDSLPFIGNQQQLQSFRNTQKHFQSPKMEEIMKNTMYQFQKTNGAFDLFSVNDSNIIQNQNQISEKSLKKKKQYQLQIPNIQNNQNIRQQGIINQYKGNTFGGNSNINQTKFQLNSQLANSGLGHTSSQEQFHMDQISGLNRGIQNITITQKNNINQKHIATSPMRNNSPIKNSNNGISDLRLIMTNSPLKKGNESQIKVSKLASIDQKLEHFLRQSSFLEREQNTRFVTFEGDQIAQQNMQLGNDFQENFQNSLKISNRQSQNKDNSSLNIDLRSRISVSPMNGNIQSIKQIIDSNKIGLKHVETINRIIPENDDVRKEAFIQNRKDINDFDLQFGVYDQKRIIELQNQRNQGFNKIISINDHKNGSFGRKGTQEIESEQTQIVSANVSPDFDKYIVAVQNNLSQDHVILGGYQGEQKNQSIPIVYNTNSQSQLKQSPSGSVKNWKSPSNLDRKQLVNVIFSPEKIGVTNLSKSLNDQQFIEMKGSDKRQDYQGNFINMTSSMGDLRQSTERTQTADRRSQMVNKQPNFLANSNLETVKSKFRVAEQKLKDAILKGQINTTTDGKTLIMLSGSQMSIDKKVKIDKRQKNKQSTKGAPFLQMKQESERKKSEKKEDGKNVGNKTNSELDHERHDSPSGLIIDKVMRLQGQILIEELSSSGPAHSNQGDDEKQSADQINLNQIQKNKRNERVSPDSSNQNTHFNMTYKYNSSIMKKQADNKAGIDDTILKNEKGSEIHIESPIQDTEKSQTFTNKMAVNIDFKNNINHQMPVKDKQIFEQNQQIEKLIQLQKDKKVDDPEQIVLMKILEKMLNKYKVVEPQVKNADYTKYKPRQWESIEDKLRTLDINAEFQKFKKEDANYKKDFINQIKTHVEEIIRTGKKVEMNTQSALIKKQKKLMSKEADIGIKLQQLRTTVTNLNLVTSESYISSDFKQMLSDRHADHSQNIVSSLTNQMLQSEIKLRNNVMQKVKNLQYSFEDLRSHSDFNFNQAEYMQQQSTRQKSKSPKVVIQELKPQEDVSLNEKQKKNRHSRSFAPLHSILTNQNYESFQSNNQNMQLLNSQNIIFQTKNPISNQFQQKTDEQENYENVKEKNLQINSQIQIQPSSPIFNNDSQIDLDDQVYLPQKKIKIFSHAQINKTSPSNNSQMKVKKLKKKIITAKIYQQAYDNLNENEIEKKEILVEVDSQENIHSKNLKPVFINQNQNNSNNHFFQINENNKNNQNLLKSNKKETYETALVSTRDFHSQYNRLENVLKFDMPAVSRKMMENSGRAFNSRLEQIYQKLRDPNGNQTQLMRHQIIKNRIKLELPSENEISFLNSSQGLNNERSQVKNMHIRNKTESIQIHNQSQDMEIGQNKRGRKSERLKQVLFKTLNPQSEQVLPMIRALSIQKNENQMSRNEYLQIGSQLSRAVQTKQHFQKQYDTLKQKHQRDQLQDLTAQEFYRKLQIQSQLQDPNIKLKKIKEKDWMSKEVLLPILGKNKTIILHSSDQLQQESISVQKQCLNVHIN